MTRETYCRVKAMRDMINSLNEAEMGGMPDMNSGMDGSSDMAAEAPMDDAAPSADDLISQFQAAIDSNDENAVRDLATIENIKTLIDHAQSDEPQDEMGGEPAPAAPATAPSM